MAVEGDRILGVIPGVDRGIDALPAIDVVVPLPAGDQVVAVLAHQLVVTIGAAKRVRSLSSLDRLCHVSALHTGCRRAGWPAEAFCRILWLKRPAERRDADALMDRPGRKRYG